MKQQDLKEPTVAELLAFRLAEFGCRHAFGIPGGETLAVIDALGAAGFEVVTTRSEAAAGLAAAGTAHVSGAPGILVVTVGPGLASSVNAVADARLERVPLVVVSGALDPSDRAVFEHQAIDQRALLAPLVKASFEIDATSCDAQIARALELAVQEPMGPVHLDLPVSVARTTTTFRRAGVRARVVSSRPDPASLEELATRLDHARRPLLIAGAEAVRAAVGPTLETLSELRGIPVLTTYRGKGLVDEWSARSLGAAGLSPGADDILLPLLREADVVVLVGYDPVEMRRSYTAPFADDAFVAELSTTRSDHRVHAADLKIVGCPRAALEALVPRAAAAAVPPWTGDAYDRLRARIAPTPTFDARAVAACLEEVLPDDVPVTVDTGAHRILVTQALRRRAGTRMFQSTGHCTMGCAIPLSLGVSLAAARTKVVAIVGDGGLEMTLGELATLRDADVPVVVVVLDDASLELIALKQRGEGFAPRAVHAGHTDFVGAARALGGRACSAGDVPTLARALRTALAEPRGFDLVHVPLARGSYDAFL